MYKYKKIKLKNGKTRDEHRLVMEKILGRKLTRFEVVHHIDGNTMNNHPSNLKLMTLSEHTKHHIKTGEVTPPTEKTIEGLLSLQMFNAKITPEIARRIKYDGEPVKKLVDELGVSKYLISKIRTGRTWKNI